MVRFFLIVCVGAALSGQTLINGSRTVQGEFDFTTGNLRLPSATSLPATCAAGQVFVDSDAQRGTKLYLCEAANTWVPQSSGYVLATAFDGSDIGAKVNTAFTSFGTNKCGTVVIPSGDYTFSTTIYVPTGCILAGVGRGADGAITGTKLLYNGTAATPAIHIADSSSDTQTSWAIVRDLAVWTNATECTNNGMLTWDPGEAASNKWKCYDGTTYTAATPHLAGVMHGSINPTTLSDGTHITIERVDVNGGGANGDINQQGAFHFGFWLNGCEECTIESSYGFQCDDGFAIGAASNSVHLDQISARINRRAGIMFRGQNDILCSMCLMESNQWWGNPSADITKYGAGIRFSDENTGGSGNAFVGIFHKVYFENNRIDMYGEPNVRASIDIDDANTGANSDRARWFQATIRNCNTLDASLSTVDQNLAVGCNWTGTWTKHASATGYKVLKITPFGEVLQVITPQNAGGSNQVVAYEQFSPGTDPTFIYRGDGGLRLENWKAATSGQTEVASSSQAFRGSHWNGSSAESYTWKLAAIRMNPGGTAASKDALVIGRGTAETHDDQKFVFQDKATMLVADHVSGDTPGITVGDSLAPGGIANNDSTPYLIFRYRSDSDLESAGGIIRSSRYGEAAGQGFLTIDAEKVKLTGTLKQAASANVASAATTALSAGNLFRITGSTGITTLNPCDTNNNGRQVVLIFDGALTVTDGSNLKLAGNFTTTADDTLTLACDGSNWYEVARSVN